MKIALIQGVLGLVERTKTNENYTELKKKHLEELAFPDTEIEILHPERGPETVETAYDESIYAPGILAKVKEAEQRGFDAAIIGCFLDPALHAAREIVNIPVVGTGQASMLLAMSLGDSFSIISLNYGSIRKRIWRNARIYGTDSRLASVRTIDMPVIELYKDDEKTKRLFTKEAQSAINIDEADVIVPGCGHFSIWAKDIEKELGVPVIDPGSAAIKLAETLARLRISHSKKAYPKPRKIKRVV